MAYAGPAVPISLANVFNVTGITSNGVPFNSGGFDGSSWAWSAELLGAAVPWEGIAFVIGPPDVPNAVWGATIPLPAGNFGSLLLLGDLVNNEVPPTAQFVIHYTDGSSTEIQQSMSDWVNPRNYPGESLVKCVPTRHNFDGSTDTNSVCAYGYRLPVDATRIVASLTLPQDRDVVVLSLVAQPAVVPGLFTYTPSVGTLLPPGQQTLFARFQPASSTFAIVNAMTELVVDPASPQITPSIAWPSPASIPTGAAIGGAQLNASASAQAGPVSIPLAPFARVNAFYDDGSRYKETGFDGSLRAFSAAQLGLSLSYAGFSFPLGQADVPDAATSTTLPLPAGNFAVLYLLGAAGNRAQLAQPVTITYTDGSSTSSQLNFSSWTSPQHFLGETIVASTTLADLSDGLQSSGTFNVYGYQLPLDSTRTVANLVLPSNADVIFLAAGLGSQTTFPVAGSFLYTPPAGTVLSSSTILNANFTPSDSVDFNVASASRQLTVGARDFTLQTINGSTMTTTTGGSTSFALMVAPVQDHYASAITFSVQGFLPPLATVTFSPSTVGMYEGPSTVALTVTTRKLTGSLSPFMIFPSAPIGLGLLVLVPFLRDKKRLRQMAWLMICFTIALGSFGCGSGYADHVYPLTIVATDGFSTHSVPVELHISATPQ